MHPAIPLGHLREAWQREHETRVVAFAALRAATRTGLQHHQAQRASQAQAMHELLAAGRQRQIQEVQNTLMTHVFRRLAAADVQCERRTLARTRLSVAVAIQLAAYKQARAASTGALLQQLTEGRTQLANAERRPGSQATPTRPTPVPAAKAPTPPPYPVVPVAASRQLPPPATVQPADDDLTSIWGVGPAVQQRLNDAGIHSYAQLVDSSPEQLRRALGEVARLANVEQWIEQARDLAELSQRT